ncbi:MAG TPA: hypothetical protein PLY09_03345 [Methanothrix sp.]|nr:hypothetical protein [Methanothrix sp.]HPJ83778.1 hypothetical protein [Methanothrix sp.]
MVEEWNDRELIDVVVIFALHLKAKILSFNLPFELAFKGAFQVKVHHQRHHKVAQDLNEAAILSFAATQRCSPSRR